MGPASPDEFDEVPMRIDLREADVARAWVESADRKRPWRAQVREAIAGALAAEQPVVRRVLELGPGPGLLAEVILRRLTLERYALVDFSRPMLDMSRERVGGYDAASFVQEDFRQPRWTTMFPAPFDAVVAMQAVHEIRSKHRLPALYRQVLTVLRPNGVFLVCDHTPFDDSARMTLLHATVDEQHAALSNAGFVHVTTLAVVNGLYLCSGRAPATEPPRAG